MSRRILSALLSLILAAGLLTSAAWAAQESPDSSTFTNLVVFCKFSGEAEFVDTEYAGVKVRDIVDNTYNKSKYSAADYFATVSNGRMKMQTLYLFDPEGGSLTLSRPRGYYAIKDAQNPDGYESSQKMIRMTELSRDWGDTVNYAIQNGSRPVDAEGRAYSFADLDRDGDGEIDLITVIYKNTEQDINVGHADPLWDYQTRSMLVSVSENGKTYTSGEYVQLTCQYANKVSGDLMLYRDGDGLIILGSPGKICHETMHALGLKDLYQSSGTNLVGYMSLMDKHTSPIGQYISVKERESLGWLNENQMKILSADGNYTIKQAAESEGVVAYKRALPNGQTLYLEYRRFDEKGNKYDCQSKDAVYIQTNRPVSGTKLNSGLICYLAKTDVKFPSNLSGGTQMDVVSAGQYSTNTDCAVDVDKSLDIYHGSGWITVTVTSMSDHELSFRITGLPENPNRTLTSVTVSGESSAVLPTASAGETTVSLTATANYDDDSHTDVTASAVWSIEGTYPGVSVANGVVTIQPSAAAGSVAIKAAYNGMDAAHTLNLKKPTHDLSDFEKSSVTAIYGDAVTGQTVTSSTGTVQYTSSDPSIVSVDVNTGAVTIHQTGAVIITAAVSEDSVYEGSSTAYTLTVTEDTLTGIAVKNGTAPVKTAYKWGEEFVIDGVIIEGIYASSKRQELPIAELSFSRTLTVGQTSVTVTYQGQSCDILGITVERATPAGTPAYTAITQSGKTLADAELTTVGSSFSVPGIVKWVETDGVTELPGTTLVSANTAYRWLFVPAEADHYNTLTGELTLWQQEIIPDQGGLPGNGGNAGAGGGNAGVGGSEDSGTVSTYPVTVTQSGKGGTVSVSHATPEKGDKVTITVEAEPGYEIDRVTVTDQNGQTVNVRTGKNGTFTFTQPDGEVTVDVTFRKVEEETPTEPETPTKPVLEKREWTSSFTDIGEKEWYYEAVKFSWEYGLMEGISDTAFAPDRTSGREQFITVLWRMAGSPVVNQPMGFDDVDENGYYAEAVRWAASEGIARGDGSGNFGVENEITREQLAVMLYRYVQSQGGGFTGAWAFRMDFQDLDQVSDWAYEAVAWCNMNGIIKGSDDKILDPKGTATRAQVAQIFMNYLALQADEA